MSISLSFTDTHLCFKGVLSLLTALTMLMREPHFPYRCKKLKKKNIEDMHVLFFTSRVLNCRAGISNYETSTTAEETLQQNTSKGPSTVPRCTAQLTYCCGSLKQTKNNKHVGKRLHFRKKLHLILNTSTHCGKVLTNFLHLKRVITRLNSFIFWQW